MPRKPLSPESATVRLNFTVPLSEAEAMREHAHRQDEGNLSRMIRRLVREDIRRLSECRTGRRSDRR